MSSNVKDVLDAPIIRLDSVDSTNNYAAKYIDADTAVDGLTIVSRSQTSGKGQRGNVWRDEPDNALLMSMIVVPQISLDQQFIFSANTAVAVADTLARLMPGNDVRIKFPNDIIINDKKAAGILIENSIRGNSWTHAIAGVGINLLQEQFPPELPHATSVYLSTGIRIWPEQLLPQLRKQLIINLKSGLNLIDRYNGLLFRKDNFQQFRKEHQEFSGEILFADSTGKLHVRLSGGEKISFAHGVCEWIW